MAKTVDEYLAAYPDWADILQPLRNIRLGMDDLEETVKWGAPTYTCNGQNVVGPVGSEDDAFYEAMGSVFGAQNFAFSHDIQATQAEIQNLNDPGYLGVDFPNAVTATFGYAAAVVTAPAIATFNAAFGTDIDVAAVGTALADGMWSAFGYDVEGPTIAEAKAKAEIEEELEKQQEEDGEGSGGPRHTTGSGDDSHDSRYDGDNASGATSEGASGQGRGPSGQI